MTYRLSPCMTNITKGITLMFKIYDLFRSIKQGGKVDLVLPEFQWKVLALLIPLASMIIIVE